MNEWVELGNWEHTGRLTIRLELRLFSWVLSSGIRAYLKFTFLLSEPDNVQLNTIRRAEERKNFDEQLKAREAELNEVLRQRELEKQREEEEMVRKMRADMVHRAQPVKR